MRSKGLHNRRQLAATTHVVYFDQCLGAAHPKRWLKYAFFTVFMAKSLKKQEMCSKIWQKNVSKYSVPWRLGKS